MAESQDERINRELKELLEEIRVILPGVQLLGALLFTVAFANRFKEFTSLERALYMTGFLSSGVTIVLLVAPTAQHRILWRQPNKEQLLRTASWLAFCGTLTLVVAMASVTYLVAEFVYGHGIASAATAAITTVMLWVWYGLPIAQRTFQGSKKESDVSPSAPNDGNTRDRADRAKVALRKS